MWTLFLLRYVVTFVFYGIAGFFLEKIIFDKGACANRSVIFTPLPPNVCIPFYPVYGIGAVILAVMDDFVNLNVSNSYPLLTALINLILKTGVSTFVLTALECIAGQFSKRGWDYSKHWGSFCNGFCSIKVSAAWAGLSLLFFICDPVKRITLLAGGGGGIASTRTW